MDRRDREYKVDKNDKIIKSKNPNDVLTQYDWDKLWNDVMKKQMVDTIKKEVISKMK